MNLLRASSSFVRGFSAQTPPTTEPGSRHCPGTSILQPQTPPWLLCRREARDGSESRVRAPGHSPACAWEPQQLCPSLAPLPAFSPAAATCHLRAPAWTQGPAQPLLQPNNKTPPHQDGLISAQPQGIRARGMPLRPGSVRLCKGRAQHGGRGDICMD